MAPVVLADLQQLVTMTACMWTVLISVTVRSISSMSFVLLYFVITNGASLPVSCLPFLLDSR